MDAFKPGDIVKLTAKHLRNTGQFTGAGHERFKVLGMDPNIDDLVIVNAPMEGNYFTKEELAADPSLKWRRIHRGNLQLASKPG
jgi:hypothetical protein